jgi:two-component system, LytTR family, sensor histidine kinase AlgZ
VTAPPLDRAAARRSDADPAPPRARRSDADSAPPRALPSDADPAPPRALPRGGFWWFVALAPPVLAAIFDPSFFMADAASNVWCLAAVYLYTGFAICLTHLLWDLLLPGLLTVLRSGPARLAAGLAVEAAAIAAYTIAMRPVLLTLNPGMVKNLPRLITQGFVVAAAYVAAGLMYTYLRGRVEREHTRAERATVAALEARLEALQARTNPHFLFNSLNTVMELVASDPELAEETLARLAAIYRYALEGAERKLVLLQDELDAVRDYLEVERARFGDRLRYEIEVAPGAASVKVPPMLVQPLVENAVLHGVGRRVEGGGVRLSARTEAGALELVVCDDGAPSDAPKHRGAGTSLRNIAERLRLLYGDAASLTTRRLPDGGFEARLRVRAP